jgi:hypothetical protein
MVAGFLRTAVTVKRKDAAEAVEEFIPAHETVLQGAKESGVF